MRSIRLPLAAAAALTTALVSPARAADPPTAAFGRAVEDSALAQARAREGVSNSTVSEGLVKDTTARNVVTGSNAISDGSFSGASGLPTVIQNTGANVLIQHSTIVNVRFQ